jgi:hypothetical protein
MPNPTELRATVAVIRENIERWNQSSWVHGLVNPLAIDYRDCGTTGCAAAWTCLRKGYRPTFHQENIDSSAIADGMFYHPDRPEIREAPDEIAARILELDTDEQDAVFQYFTDDIDAFAARVEEVIAGEWSGGDYGETYVDVLSDL